MDHKLTGKYIRRVNDGFSWKGLTVSIGIMWCMIFFTAFVVFDYGTMRFVMLGLGLIGTISQIIVLSKKKKKKAVLMPIDLPDNNVSEEDELKVS